MTLSRQFLVFCIFGTAGFVIDVAVLYAFAPHVGWLAGRIVSFLAAASATWWLNRRYTFARNGDATAGRAGRQYARYLVSMLAGGAVNYLTYVGVLAWMQHPHAPGFGVALGSIAGMGINFLSARFLVFRKSA